MNISRTPTSVAPALGAVIDLGGQHVGQIGQVARPRTFGHLGQMLRFGPHRGP